MRDALSPVVLSFPDLGRPEGAAELAVRPKLLCRRAGVPGDGELPGTVQRSADLDDHMEYEVTVPELPRPFCVVGPDTRNPVTAGTAVSIALDAAGVALVPAS